MLQFSWKDDGSIEMSFHIYDALGQLVADSGGDAPVAAVLISAEDGEVLLDIPAEPTSHIQYRLYSQAGRLLTTSDGVRTQIYSFLKMETKSAKYGVEPPDRRRKAVPVAIPATPTHEDIRDETKGAGAEGAILESLPQPSIPL
ncbi:MAG: hypothetical protein GEU75_01895 [Dehalococcoidia bacterium]|nr:hypothetical protein [Dehalococcoidia bacterium]